MKFYEVYVRDSIQSQFWSVNVEAADTTKLADVFKYAEARLFGGSAIGMKEFLTQPPEFFHGEKTMGMKGF
jgi:hypothetical protein